MEKLVEKLTKHYSDSTPIAVIEKATWSTCGARNAQRHCTESKGSRHPENSHDFGRWFSGYGVQQFEVVRCRIYTRIPTGENTMWGIIAITQQGLALGKKLKVQFPDSVIYTLAKWHDEECTPIEPDLSTFTAQLFDRHKTLVYIMATGTWCAALPGIWWVNRWSGCGGAWWKRSICNKFAFRTFRRRQCGYQWDSRAMVPRRSLPRLWMYRACLRWIWLPKSINLSLTPCTMQKHSLPWR